VLAGSSAGWRSCLIVTMIVAIVTAKRDALHGIPIPASEEWTYIVLAVWIAVADQGHLAGPPPAACNVLSVPEHSSAETASSGHGS